MVPSTTTHKDIVLIKLSVEQSILWETLAPVQLVEFHSLTHSLPGKFKGYFL